MTSSAIVKSRWRHRQVYVSLSQLYANIHFQKRFWESVAVFCEYNCYFSPFIVRQALHFSGIERAIKWFILSIFYISIQPAKLPERWNNSSLMSAAVKKQKFQNFIIVPTLILREPVSVEDSTRGSRIQMFLRKSRILIIYKKHSTVWKYCWKILFQLKLVCIKILLSFKISGSQSTIVTLASMCGVGSFRNLK